jgi:endogenous inhibitor of DNA gyrase (YacG/DUF329 family)
MRGFRLRCPICKKEAAWEDNPNRPFCSERCRLIDLGAWADEGYSIAGRDEDDNQPSEGGTEEEKG